MEEKEVFFVKTEQQLPKKLSGRLEVQQDTQKYILKITL